MVLLMYFDAVRADKTLDVAILRRLTVQLNLFLFSPELHVVAGVLRAIIDAYAFGLTMEVNKVIECSSNARSGERPTQIESEVLTIVIVDHIKNTHLAAIHQAVAHGCA